jgi:hypothetical protein
MDTATRRCGVEDIWASRHADGGRGDPRAGGRGLRARTNRGWPETPFAEVRGGRFWSSAVYFPTEGCWRVTGRVGATSLTFVVFMPN